MNKIIDRAEYTISEEVIDFQYTTDCIRTVILSTKEYEFTFEFSYGNLINFTRCKK